MGGGPTFQYGDMFQAWNSPGATFIVTGNAYLNRHGELVMGRGAAKQLSERVNGINKMLADVIRERGTTYRFFVLEAAEIQKVLGHWCRVFCDVGIFQVKEHFRDKADLNIIQEAVLHLDVYAQQKWSQQIHMNMPGTGWGRLSESSVLPLLRQLPANVNIWRFGHEEPRGGA